MEMHPATSRPCAAVALALELAGVADSQRCPTVDAGCMAARARGRAPRKDWHGHDGRTGSTGTTQRRRWRCAVRLLKLGGFCGLLRATGEHGHFRATWR